MESRTKIEISIPLVSLLNSSRELLPRTIYLQFHHENHGTLSRPDGKLPGSPLSPALIRKHGLEDGLVLEDCGHEIA